LSLLLFSITKEEWSLVRHPSEHTFGIQLAGNKPATLVPVAVIMAKEFAGNLDFVDLNCGCPINLVFKNGAGSVLLDQPAKLGRILLGMNTALGEIPLTLKVRTGIKDGRNTVHRLMERVGPEWGAGAITIHGRTRQQWYTKLAEPVFDDQVHHARDSLFTPFHSTPSIEQTHPNSYIVVTKHSTFPISTHLMPLWNAVESTGVDAAMVAGGALIKSWIFTESKERRECDISSRGRLDLIRKVLTFGLGLGSDTAGVNTTRRYLGEALSFQHRYIPIGLLELLPGRLNDRPPSYHGRDEPGVPNSFL
ncbi:dihydrouridine synthase-domain-containing protein, partial [Gautieria morchelliformis]